tara:strand:+ start:1153 stop:1494 length:342 start_codon:yes stop_codon:yes gene_type:complete
MANEENLIPYKKGQSGNPKGRPKGSKNRSSVARKWLQVEQDLKNPLTSEIETMSQEDLMTLALIKKAREGDTQAYQKLLDSAYGAPVQQVEQTNIELPFFNLDADRNNGSKED